MKHFAKFTNILMAAFVAVSMIGFSSCNDEVADDMTDLKTSLEKEVKDLNDQVDDLEDQLKTLQNQVNNINSCTCDFNKVIQLVQDSLANYWNINEVQNFVNQELSNYVQWTVYNAAMDSIRQALADANASIAANAYNIDSLAQVTIDLNNAIATTNALANAANQLARNDSMRIDTLSLHVTNIENVLQTTVQQAADAYALAFRDSIRINALESAYTQLQAKDQDLQDQMDSIKEVITNFATHAEVNDVLDSARTYYNEAIHYTDSLFTIAHNEISALDSRVTTAETLIGVLSNAVADLQTAVSTLQGKVSTLEQQVEKNTKDIAALAATVKDVFSKQIYSVVLQGSVNPVFGYFALPVGVQSNVLLSYYGQNEHVTYFPTESTSDLVYEQYALTSADVAMLGGTVDTWSIAGQTTFLGDSANAGKLYLSVNPSTADLTGAEFTLVNSLDEESPIKLDSLTPCTDKLTFGYTKAPVKGTATNGFYQATATLAEGDIDAAKIQVDATLKSAVKDFYNQLQAVRSNETGAVTAVKNINYSGLASGIYNQINGFLPAYAVKATWSDSLGTHSTYSNYGVAAAAVKPLSYAFLKDKNLGKLPNITPISDINLSMGSVNFTLPTFQPIVFNDIDFSVSFNIAFDNITVSDMGDLMVWVKIPKYAATVSGTTATVTALPIDQNNPATYDSIKVNLSSVSSEYNAQIQAIVNQVNQKVTDLCGNINQNVQNNMVNAIKGEINNRMQTLIGSINTQIQDMMNQVQGSMNSSVNDVLNQLSNKVNNNVNNYIHKLNTFISKLNSAVNRANNLLNNVNKFLQPVLVYEGKDSELHLMSTDKNFPTTFTGSGAIVLHPTSYNAEIAAPAYKKFVAVTNVFKNGASAQGGDAACRSALNTANAQGMFNKVIDGNNYKVAFVGQAGYTYEIFYSALDYSGKISQRKYYVTVK